MNKNNSDNDEDSPLWNNFKLWYLKNDSLEKGLSFDQLLKMFKILDYLVEFRDITEKDFDNLSNNEEKNKHLENYKEYLGVSIPSENNGEEKIKVIISKNNCKKNKKKIEDVLLFELTRCILEKKSILEDKNAKSCWLEIFNPDSSFFDQYIFFVLKFLQETVSKKILIELDDKYNNNEYKKFKKNQGEPFILSIKTLKEISTTINSIPLIIGIYVFCYSAVGIFNGNIFNVYSNILFFILGLGLLTDVFYFKKYIRLFEYENIETKNFIEYDKN